MKQMLTLILLLIACGCRLGYEVQIVSTNQPAPAPPPTPVPVGPPPLPIFRGEITDRVEFDLEGEWSTLHVARPSGRIDTQASHWTPEFSLKRAPDSQYYFEWQDVSGDKLSLGKDHELGQLLVWRRAGRDPEFVIFSVNKSTPDMLLVVDQFGEYYVLDRLDAGRAREALEYPKKE